MGADLEVEVLYGGGSTEPLAQLPQFHAQGVFDLSVKWRKDYTTFREFSFVEAGAIVVSATGSPVASSAGRCSVFG